MSHGVMELPIVERRNGQKIIDARPECGNRLEFVNKSWNPKKPA